MPESAAGLLQLAADLRHEVAALRAIVAEARACTERFAASPPSRLEIRGAGDIAHDAYNAVERYLERVAVSMSGGVPAGADSHARLLDQMTRELARVRPAVLRATTRRRLGEYLRFRHLYRHRYGYELEWERLRPLLEGLVALEEDLVADLDAFAGFVEGLARSLE